MNNSICTLFDNILIDIHKFKSLHYEKHSTKVFILFGTAKPKAKKQCFTTYINHLGEIFNVVNRIHKIKKEAPHH